MYLSDCPVRATINVIDGKWKPIIVNALKLRTLRFGELRRHVPEATTKVLTEQSRELEQDQVIAREILGRRGERVEYRLTSYGRTLLPVLTLMAKWGKQHKRVVHSTNVSRSHLRLIESRGRTLALKPISRTAPM